MHILFTNDSPLIKYGLAQGIVDVGHEATFLGLWRYPADQQFDVLRRVIERVRPDALLTEGFPGLNWQAIQLARETAHVPHIYWAIEDPVQHEESLEIASFSDYTFTTTAECLPSYAERGLRASLLLFACNPHLHRHVAADGARIHDIVLVATNYRQRAAQVRALLLPLIEDGYDVMVWGHGWTDPQAPITLRAEQYGGAILPYEDLAAVYSAARIVLGLHLVEDSRTQTSMRTYEALGCGACYLTYDTLAHRSLFEPGRHLLCSGSPAETRQIVAEYLTDRAKRNAVAVAGQQLVYAQHTYAQRAGTVIAALESVR